MNEEVYNINQRSETRDLVKFRLCGTTFPDPSYKISRKYSNTACIEYVESGCGEVNIDGKTFYPSGGDSYFLQAGRDHYYFSDRVHPWKKHFINLSGKLVDSLTEGYSLGDVSYFEGLDTSAELARIIELAREGRDDCTSELISIVNEIFLKMHNHVKSRSAPLGIEAEMKDFLNTQITSDFRIEQLCRHISRSESQTIRIFKKAYGITPYNYVLGKKLGLAKRLLEDTNLSIKEISDKLCFADEYYFSNLFKRKVGMTPSAYRKKK